MTQPIVQLDMNKVKSCRGAATTTIFSGIVVQKLPGYILFIPAGSLLMRALTTGKPSQTYIQNPIFNNKTKELKSFIFQMVKIWFLESWANSSWPTLDS